MSDSEDTEDSCAEWPIGKEWLENMLNKRHNGDEVTKIQVKEFTVRPGCTTGESVLSDILAVNVDYLTSADDEVKKISAIVKLLPQDPFSRYFVTEAQFDLREIKFYTQVSII